LNEIVQDYAAIFAGSLRVAVLSAPEVSSP